MWGSTLWIWKSREVLGLLGSPVPASLDENTGWPHAFDIGQRPPIFYLIAMTMHLSIFSDTLYYRAVLQGGGLLYAICSYMYVYCICCPNCLVCSALLLALTTHPHTTTSASGIPTVRRHQRRASAHCDNTVRFIQKLHFHRILYYCNCMNFSIVKDLGVNFKIVQNWPTI